eukprot:3348634-Amphidinium_carterae.6
MSHANRTLIIPKPPQPPPALGLGEIRAALVAKSSVPNTPPPKFRFNFVPNSWDCTKGFPWL